MRHQDLTEVRVLAEIVRIPGPQDLYQSVVTTKQHGRLGKMFAIYLKGSANKQIAEKSATAFKKELEKINLESLVERLTYGTSVQVAGRLFAPIGYTEGERKYYVEVN